MPLLAFYCNASLLPQRGKETAKIRDMLRELAEEGQRKRNAIYVITRGHKEERKAGRRVQPRDFKPVILILEKPATE